MLQLEAIAEGMQSLLQHRHDVHKVKRRSINRAVWAHGFTNGKPMGLDGQRHVSIIRKHSVFPNMAMSRENGKANRVASLRLWAPSLVRKSESRVSWLLRCFECDHLLDRISTHRPCDARCCRDDKAAWTCAPLQFQNGAWTDH